MIQGERVREVRKTLGLTLDKFGERIGIKKSTLSLIENGKNNLTDSNIKAICREFGVDYMWLTTGEGEMFVDSDDEFFNRIDRIMTGEDEARKNIFKALIDSSDEDIAAFWRFINKANEYAKGGSHEKEPESGLPPFDVPGTSEGVHTSKAGILNAAHADDYANAPEELKRQEEDIMDDEDF